MRKLFLLLAPLALVGCATIPAVPTAPADVADATVLDERGAIAVETAYGAAALALETAVDAGLLRGPAAATAKRLEQRAYDATLAARAAYDAGNASTYPAALSEARKAIAAALVAINGSE